MYTDKELILKNIDLKPAELADFFDEYALLRQSSDNEQQVLETMLAYQSKRQKKFIQVLLESETLIDGLHKFPNSIPAYIIALIEKAKQEEKEGAVLEAIAYHLLKHGVTSSGQSLKEKLRKNFTYPFALLGVVYILVTMLMVFVIPVYKDLFDSFGADLPSLTLFLLEVSDFFVGSFTAVLILVVVIFLYLKSSISLNARSRLMLIPPFGVINREIESINVLNALQLLLSFDFSTSDALRWAGSATKNTVIQKALIQSAENSESGQSFTDNLIEAKIFSEKTAHILAVMAQGETLDLLPKLIAHINRKLSGDSSSLLRNFNVVLLFLCWLIVGVTVIGMYLPIFKLGAAIG